MPAPQPPNEVKMPQELSARIEYLETRVAFQDHAIEQLSQELAEQQRQQDKLRQQMDAVISKLREGGSSQIASQSEETPPPHY
jgi:SlyX protein